ncbi:MAG: DUF222 domain-containing protein [Lysobacterales bacterium]
MQQALSATANHARPGRCRQLESQITEMAAHIHAATFRLLELVREFDEIEGWAGPGMRSCAHWLNWKCGINLGAAREKVRVAHALQDLPLIRERFRKGEVSYSKVRAMTRVATPENEDYLLMIARHGTAAHVERLVRQYRKLKRIEALERDNERHALRELNWYFDDDGSFVMKGRFTPEHGMLIKKVLESIMDEDFLAQQDVAQASLSTGSRSHLLSAETPGDKLKPRSEPIAQRRADALVTMAEAYWAHPGKTCSSDNYLVHVHTDMAILKADGEGAESELEEGRNVSAETSRRLACDAGVVHWLDGQNGEPINIGRKSRAIPPATRRALQRRDQGCRFPGCTCTRFVDAHHIKHWADGGETSLDNLVLLCRHHHRAVHEGGFSVHALADGRICFIDPKGRRLPASAEGRFRGNVFRLFADNAHQGIHITPQTGACRWQGERMDDDLAVLGMLQLE